MIVEFFKHLTTPAPTPVKKLGFVAGSIAIEARFKRCHKHWHPHLGKTKQIIMNEVSKLPKGANILVLGAGGLFDLPYETIINEGKNLSLFDIVFLRSTRKKVRGNANLALIEGDITSYVASFYSWTENPENPIPEPTSPPAIENIMAVKPDLVISLNIISQLPIQFGQKAAKLKPNSSFDATAKKLMEQHLSWLVGLNCPTLVVGDMVRVLMDGDKLIEEENIPLPAGLGEPFDTWLWHIAPKGEIHKNLSFSHKVGAWRLNP